MCILIIEDETKIASYLVKGLIESGYTAECVHSGLEGLERLKMKSYSLVILDVMLMPYFIYYLLFLLLIVVLHPYSYD